MSAAPPFVERVRDEASGLDAFVAVDRRVGGVAAGGIRIKRYDSEREAAADAAALARAMSFKAALAGVRVGGAKVTVRADRLVDRAAALAALGRHVEAQAGTLYVGPDFGFTDDDVVSVGATTRYVDPPRIAARMAEATAIGVRAAIEAALSFDSPTERRLTVAIQGVGKVGAALGALLLAEGHEVAGVDVEPARVAAAGLRALPVDDEEALWAGAWDVIAPCALGGAVDRARAERLRCRVLVGAANHLLAAPEADVALALTRRGVLHVPDYLANAGALVYWAEAVLARRDDDEALAATRAIGETARDVLSRARREGRTPLAVADEIARARLA